MTETEKKTKIRQISQNVKRLKAEYGVEGPRQETLTPVTPKKKKPGTIRRVIETIKKFIPKIPVPKPKKKVTPPSGYAGMTPAQKKEWGKVMKQTGGK